MLNINISAVVQRYARCGTARRAMRISATSFRRAPRAACASVFFFSRCIKRRVKQAFRKHQAALEDIGISNQYGRTGNHRPALSRRRWVTDNNGVGGGGQIWAE